MYNDLVKRLRAAVDGRYEKCDGCPYEEDYPCCVDCLDKMHKQAAEAIEELSEQLLEMGQVGKFLLDVHKINSKMVAPESVPTDSEWWSHYKALLEVLYLPRWIPVTDRLPECDLGAEVGNIEWISCGMVHAGCFGRGGKYRDAYFRTWTDAGEGMDAKDADYWRAVTIPQPPKEET